MSLNKLKLRGFRSYSEQVFQFSSGLNLIIGPNGAGKTNLLEAIYTLANTRSWRETDRHLVKEGQPGYQLEGDIGKRTLRLEYKLAPLPQKLSSINQTATSTKDYLGQIRTVLFEPNSLDIITGGPEARRLWLDQVLSIYNPEYLLNLLRFKRTLRQRNALLKNHRTSPIKEQIFAWNLGLTQTASWLVAIRLDFLNYLNKHLAKSYQMLAGAKTNLSLSYQTRPPSLRLAADYNSALLARLEHSLEADLRYGFTTIGPHRDDVAFIFKNRPAAQVASRGETRTIALAIKLVEYKWLSTVRGVGPVILLFDDIFSELDQTRRAHTLIQLKGAQIFITTTDIKGLSRQLGPHAQTIKL